MLQQGTTAGDTIRREIEVEIKGQIYTARELKLKEYGEIENFIKSKLAKQYREVAEGSDPDAVDAMTMKILKTPLEPEELGEQIQAIDAQGLVVFLALRHNPGMTRQYFNELVDMENFAEIAELVENISDANPPEEEGDGGEENPIAVALATPTEMQSPGGT